VTQPNSADLLGYMLGALDATETQQIENAIKENPDLEKELANVESMVAPLEHLDYTSNVPPGVARRTVEYVAGQHRDVDMDSMAEPDIVSDVSKVENSKVDRMTTAVEYGGRGRNWSLTDVLVVCVSVALLIAIAIPTIQYTRHQNQLAKCENNLRQVGNALMSYRDISGKSSFLQIPQCSDRRFDVAGFYAPALKNTGLVEDDSVFFCAGNLAQYPTDQPRSIPTIDEIKQADDLSLVDLKRNMGGDFGYCMGYYDKKNRYCSPESRGRPNYAILADKPSMTLPGHSTSNHGGNGQNVWFEDGHIEFLPNPETRCGDAIYLNNNGECAPSLCPNDSCIGSSCSSVLKPNFP